MAAARYWGKNLSTKAKLTWTVPSSLGRARIWLTACSKYVSFSKPRAAMTSQSRSMTRSPSIVTFILVMGLNNR